MDETRPQVETHPYKVLPNGKPILLDIYTPAGLSSSARDSTPIVLYFHAGGLTSYNRKCLSASRIQACLSREWIFVSADYRLLPQASAEEILEDMKDAYEFVVAQLPGRLHMSSASRGAAASRKVRRIIVAGASAGAYLAFLAARYYDQLSPPPKAILSYYGIPSFNGPFFNSSKIIWGDQPLPREKFEALLQHTEVFTGDASSNEPFDLACLNADLTPNTSYIKPETAVDTPDDDFPRSDLYDYYVQENIYPTLFKDIEKEVIPESNFPKCVLIHGDKDVDVPLEVSESFVKEVGEDHATLIVVEGAGHSFDEGIFLQDESAEMEAVKKAWALLDKVFS